MGAFFRASAITAEACMKSLLHFPLFIVNSPNNRYTKVKN